MNWKYIRDYVLARASEKSSWVGLFAFLASVAGVAVAPDQAALITSVGTGLAGLLIAAMKEKGSDK